jgi:hypothetical protein
MKAIEWLHALVAVPRLILGKKKFTALGFMTKENFPVI